MSSQFHLLASLCQLSQTASADVRREFATNQLITPTMLPPSSFEAQVKTLVEQAYHNLLIEQRRRIRLISIGNQLNQLQTAFASNYLYFTNIPSIPYFQNIMYVERIVLF